MPEERALVEDEPHSFGEAWRATFAVRTLRRLTIATSSRRPPATSWALPRLLPRGALRPQRLRAEHRVSYPRWWRSWLAAPSAARSSTTSRPATRAVSCSCRDLQPHPAPGALIYVLRAAAHRPGARRRAHGPRRLALGPAVERRLRPGDPARHPHPRRADHRALGAAHHHPATPLRPSDLRRVRLRGRLPLHDPAVDHRCHHLRSSAAGFYELDMRNAFTAGDRQRDGTGASGGG